MGHKSYAQIAAAMYAAYTKELARLMAPGAQNRPMCGELEWPEWDELEPIERACWEASARQAVAELATAGITVSSV